MTTMKFYEIRNTKTQECFTAAARNFQEACRQNGHKPYECRCVWKASASDMSKLFSKM